MVSGLGHVQIGIVTADRHCQAITSAASPAPPHLVAHDGNPDAVGCRTMLFFRRYPRFTLLLSVLLIASLLLLTRSPFPSLQPSSAPPTPTQPLNSSTAPHGLASRVRRAERAYQKMLLGRNALISKVGPTPHDVALCVPHYPSLLFANWSSHDIRFPPDKEPWPPYTVCKSLLNAHP